MRTCATSGTSDQTSVVTGLPDSASKVAAPTKCSAPGVGTTRTSCPTSVRARSRKAALYAATPPLTPSTIRLIRSFSRQHEAPGTGHRVLRHPFGEWCRSLACGVGEQALVDLAQRDGQRLLLRCGVDQRADVLQQPLGELAVVGVDLPGTL